MSIFSRLFNKAKSEQHEQVDSTIEMTIILSNQILNKEVEVCGVKCPYCGFSFKDIPQRKRKCPECKNTIYIQKNDKDIHLMTEDQHREHEIIKTLNLIGISENAFEKYKLDYFQKFGEKAIYDDFLWSLFHFHLNEKARIQEFYEMGVLYNLLADLVVEQPAEYAKLRKMAMSMELHNYTKSDLDLLVEVISYDNSCDSCKQLSKKIFTLSEAIKELPLPNEHCMHEGGCRCCYGAVVNEM